MALPIIAAIAIGAAALAVIVVALLKFEDIKNFLRSKQKLTEKDKANTAFTLKESLANGNYAVVSGIFNRNSGEITVEDGGKPAAQKYEAKELDKELEAVHNGRELVIYT